MLNDMQLREVVHLALFCLSVVPLLPQFGGKITDESTDLQLRHPQCGTHTLLLRCAVVDY